MRVARLREQPADAGQAAHLAAVGVLIECRPGEAQQGAQALQAAAGIVDAGGDILAAGKRGLGGSNLLQADAAHALGDRLVQLEAEAHGWNRTRCGGRAPPNPPVALTETSVTILSGRSGGRSNGYALQPSAHASHWRTRASGSGWVKKSVITATLSAPAARHAAGAARA